MSPPPIPSIPANHPVMKLTMIGSQAEQYIPAVFKWIMGGILIF